MSSDKLYNLTVKVTTEIEGVKRKLLEERFPSVRDEELPIITILDTDRGGEVAARGKIRRLPRGENI